MPSDSTADDIFAKSPEGILLSNGPGDPRDLTEIIPVISELAGKGIPLLGICLGHQLLALALKMNIYKLKFGHHGGNHPVKDIETTKCCITSQNHNYAVSPDNIPSDIKLTHINVNDKTVEGFRHKNLPLLSIQYHPEAAPGPEDSAYIFDDFVDMMKGSSDA